MRRTKRCFRCRRRSARGFGLIVVDESFWQDGITTTSRLVIAVSADELKAFPVRYKGVTEVESWTNDLRKLIRQLQHALEMMPDGYVQRQPLIDAGLDKPATADGDSPCTTAGKLEWQRKVDTELRPGASAEQRKAAVEKFGFMGQLRRRHRMWRTLHELIAGSEETTGRLKIETIKTKDGPVRCLRLLGRKDIADKLIGLPIIVADATLPLEIVKHFLPNLDLVRDLNVEAPHMKITQVIGLPVGKIVPASAERQANVNPRRRPASRASGSALPTRAGISSKGGAGWSSPIRASKATLPASRMSRPRTSAPSKA